MYSFSVYRADGNQNNLRGAAYEALMEMVKNSPKDCYVTVQKTTMVILERLQRVLQMEVGGCMLNFIKECAWYLFNGENCCVHRVAVTSVSHDLNSS